MRTQRQLSVKLTGPEGYPGDVALDEFRDFCAALMSCPKAIEDVLDEGARLNFLVVGLRKGSAALRLAPVATQGRDTGSGPRVLKLFTDTAKALERGKSVDERLNGHALLPFKRLVRPLTNGKASGIQVGRFRLTARVAASVDEILAAPAVSEGEASGMIEKLNGHGDRHEFTLFPPIGVPITCQFRESLFPTVKQAIKRHVTIAGRLLYYPGSPFPERAKVSHIDTHPDEADLPELSDLRGLLCDDGDPRPAAEIIRGIRDG